MSSQFLAVVVIAALSSLFVEVNGCGFPMPPPPPPMAPICQCSAPPPCAPPPPCACGRKKREAVIPHLKTEEHACPQEGWKSLIVNQMGDDATNSAFAIQSTLYKKFDAKFFVSCASANEEQPSRLSVSGDGFCIVKTDKLVCQVVSISA